MTVKPDFYTIIRIYYYLGPVYLSETELLRSYPSY